MISAASLTAADYHLVSNALIRDLNGDCDAAVIVARIDYRTHPKYSDGWWTGTVAELAEETGMRPKQVEHILAKLRSGGHVEASRRYLKGPRDQTLSYRLLKDETPDIATAPDPGIGANEPPVTPDTSPNPGPTAPNPGRLATATAPDPGTVPITDGLETKTGKTQARKRASAETMANSSTPDKSPRATRLPADWVPSADLVAWGRRDRLPDDFMRRETENFRDFWTAHAGPTARKLSWDAAWRTWMRKAADHARLAHPVISRAQRETDDLFAAAAARMVPHPPTLGEFNDARRNLGTDPFSESGLPSAENGSVHTGRVAPADGGPALW